MPRARKYITVDEALTVLSIIGEEDSIGFEDDDEVNDAIELIQLKIEVAISEKKIKRNQTLLSWS